MYSCTGVTKKSCVSQEDNNTFRYKTHATHKVSQYISEVAILYIRQIQVFLDRDERE